MSKHVAMYLRVSTRSQDLASQEPDLKRWAAAQAEPVEWYRDKFTGKTMDRPGWNRLDKALQAGKVASIVVWRLDRLGRTTAGVAALCDDLRERKINLVSLKEGFDLATPGGRLMANVLASMAQYETEVRAERVYAGLEVARENGVRLGRPAGRHTRIKVKDEQQETIYRMADEKQSVSAMARATGLSRPTVYSVLAERSE
jgi:DNA invertase Pin-like site-specific DNA recombinase